MQNIIFSIGHSNRGFSEFLKKLQDNEIDTIIDIRTFPRSRFNPQFNEKRLATALNEHSITYLFKGKNLGGRGQNTDYEETIDELVEMIERGRNVCVMCSEGNYKDCHRHTVLEPSFTKRNINMNHLSY